MGVRKEKEDHGSSPEIAKHTLLSLSCSWSLTELECMELGGRRLTEVGDSEMQLMWGTV